MSLIERRCLRVVHSEDVRLVAVAAVYNDLVADAHDQQGSAPTPVELTAEAPPDVGTPAADEVGLCIPSRGRSKGNPSLVNHLVLVELQPEISSGWPHVVVLGSGYHIAEELHVLLRQPAEQDLLQIGIEARPDAAIVQARIVVGGNDRFTKILPERFRWCLRAPGGEQRFDRRTGARLKRRAGRWRQPAEHPLPFVFVAQIRTDFFNENFVRGLHKARQMWTGEPYFFQFLVRVIGFQHEVGEAVRGFCRCQKTGQGGDQFLLSRPKILASCAERAREGQGMRRVARKTVDIDAQHAVKKSAGWPFRDFVEIEIAHDLEIGSLASFVVEYRYGGRDDALRGRSSPIPVANAPEHGQSQPFAISILGRAHGIRPATRNAFN